MDLLSFLIGLILLLPIQRQDNGLQYLENVIGKFSGIKDYTVDVRVHLDIQEVKAPDMDAKVYYKEPDKVKIDSKGLFFLPKDVGVFNPRKFNPKDFDISVIDTLTYNGDPAVRVSLTSKKDEAKDHKIILTIDKKDWLIKEIATAPSPGRQVSAKISYGVFDGFELPVKIEVNLDVAKVNPQMGSFDGERRRGGGVKGNVEVYYSNYKINTGLSDEIFKKEGDR